MIFQDHDQNPEGSAAPELHAPSPQVDPPIDAEIKTEPSHSAPNPECDPLIAIAKKKEPQIDPPYVEANPAVYGRTPN